MEPNNEFRTNKRMNLKRDDIIYPNVSFEIVGAAFDVHNEIGGGHREKYYQNALELALKKRGLQVQKEVHCPLEFQGEKVGKYFFDFVVNRKIIIEIKRGRRYSRRDVDQVLQYLRSGNFALALLITFQRDRVITKRIVNFEHQELAN